MTPQEIGGWFWSARTKLIALRGRDPRWWPSEIRAGNDATALAYMFFLEAAASRCLGKTLTLAAHAEAGSSELAAIEHSWNAPPARQHSPHEVLVDFSVHNWDAASPIQLTGESEANPYWRTGDSLKAPDDYSWDFYKLLVVPSATRLFFARLGKSGGVEIPERIEALTATLQGLIDWYAPALLRPHDELGGLILPTRRTFAAETRFFWLDRGRLFVERATNLPADVTTRVEEAAPEGET